MEAITFFYLSHSYNFAGCGSQQPFEVNNYEMATTLLLPNWSQTVIQ